MRGGRWIQAELCAECARRRRTAIVPLVTAALSTVALAAGAAYAIDRLTRDGNETPAVNPADWAKRLRGGTPTLSAFSRDLTAAARDNMLDPVIGRDDEVERVIAILSRRSKNNPVLVGEPGVGKTAVVEGLAQRIVRGEVPAALRNKRVVALSVGPLVAGTKYRGEFEGRVKRILDEHKVRVGQVELHFEQYRRLWWHRSCCFCRTTSLLLLLL
jgi:ATP-dependent Clp protease ATP-binding subunit ClpA